MFLAPDRDEMEITDAAARFLAEAMPIARLHEDHCADMDVAMRHALGDMGWFALALPKGAGGSGLSPVEHALFFREVGRLCGPVDVLAQCLAAMTVDEPELRTGLLSGEYGVALALASGSGLRIIGSHDARYALQVTRQVAKLIELNAAEATERPALNPANSMRVTEPAVDRIVSESDDVRIWQMGQLGTSAMLIGIAEATLDLIVEYAKVRETFGRKIGSYQAVRHSCADMALRAEAGRCQLWFAAAAMKEGRLDVDTHLAAAKHLANQAALANADSNIQLHGGIGITEEHSAHLLLKHAMMLSKLFGTTRELLDRLLNATAED